MEIKLEKDAEKKLVTSIKRYVMKLCMRDFRLQKYLKWHQH